MNRMSPNQRKEFLGVQNLKAREMCDCSMRNRYVCQCSLSLNYARAMAKRVAAATCSNGNVHAYLRHRLLVAAGLEQPILKPTPKGKEPRKAIYWQDLDGQAEVREGEGGWLSGECFVYWTGGDKQLAHDRLKGMAARTKLHGQMLAPKAPR